MHTGKVGRTARLAGAILGTVALFAVFAGTASAAATVEHFTFNGLEVGEFYGPVACKGVFDVNKKFPQGKEIERCESTSPSGKLEGLKGGEEGSGATGGFPFSGFAGWESDDSTHAGLKTTNFSYKVNKADTRFKLIAIY